MGFELHGVRGHRPLASLQQASGILRCSLSVCEKQEGNAVRSFLTSVFTFDLQTNNRRTKRREKRKRGPKGVFFYLPRRAQKK